MSVNARLNKDREPAIAEIESIRSIILTKTSFTAPGSGKQVQARDAIGYCRRPAAGQRGKRGHP
jgi:hypothetical protein